MSKPGAFDLDAVVQSWRDGRPIHGDEDWHRLADLLAPIIVEHDLKVVTISGSQGSGKSTLAKVLLNYLPPKFLTVSLDDYYLSADARRHLAEEVHPLMATRGVPGTHDIDRLKSDLKTIRGGATLTHLPVFDKGRDDVAQDRAVEARGLVLEGWCLGAPPQQPSRLVDPINVLESREDSQGVWRRWVNQRLADDYTPVWDESQFWIHLSVPGFEQVLAWRTEQEQALPFEQRMSALEIERFIGHYERITRHMWSEPPRSPGIQVQLDRKHRLVSVTAID